nr:MAG TPA: hypothetical protein [Caudoviricetes sp.]
MFIEIKAFSILLIDKSLLPTPHLAVNVTQAVSLSI